MVCFEYLFADLLLTTNAHSAHSKSTTHFDHELAFSTTIELKTAKTKFQDFYEKLSKIYSFV